MHVAYEKDRMMLRVKIKGSNKNTVVLQCVGDELGTHLASRAVKLALE